MKKLIYTLLVFAILVTIQVKAQNPLDTVAHKKIKVRVDGLSCPFCAYGLEKKAIGMDGVDSVKIDVTKGLMTLKIKNGKMVTEEEIKKQVKKAGFTPGKISYPDPD